MPYVDQKTREHLEGALDIIECTLYNDSNFAPGNVNYVITRLLIRWWKKNPKYVTICLIVGTLFCVAFEFYRRVAINYEGYKISKNGDVYE